MVLIFLLFFLFHPFIQYYQHQEALMRIHTTINANAKIKIKLELAAEAIQRDVSTLVVMLFNRIINEHGKYLRYGDAVKYQKKIQGDEWKRVHLFLNPRDYEFIFDMRKLFKQSASLLLSTAVQHYLDKIIETFQNSTFENNSIDNYQLQCHILSRIYVKNAICWKTYWGLPKHKEHIFT